jgi:hypothetical protein
VPSLSPHDCRLSRYCFCGPINRWEWSRTTASAISERRASVTPPSVLHVASHSVVSRDGRNRTDFLVFPRHAGARCPSSRYSVTCSSSLSGPYGSRTHLPALKERYPPTDRRTGRRRAPRAQRVGRRSNPRLLVFSQVLDRLSYRPEFCGFCPREKSMKKARCRCNTGPDLVLIAKGAECHRRKG